MAAQAFDQDIRSWDVTHLINMNKMFYSVTSFNHLLCWKVTITNTNEMFYDSSGKLRPYSACLALDNNSIREALEEYHSSSSGNDDDLIYGPIADWNMSKVTNMNRLFYLADNFNSNISQWVVSNVTDMEDMFNFATVFN